MEKFVYNIDDTSCFKFKDNVNGFELMHKIEGSSSRSLGVYESGLWKWETEEQKALWFNMLKSNGKKMQTAFKMYYRTRPEQSTEVTFRCAKRRINIKYNKFRTKFQNKLIDIFYGSVSKSHWR